ncbi:MAG TPA: Nramp family divalent metal transporter [Humisphaera sp.]|nr:Nramp family divalent metal transporter [Humisphaera sp.]
MDKSNASTLIEHEPQRGDEPRKGFFHRLGPGLITGASDDDPSGIATYSQAGATFGYGMLWTALLTLPLMVAIQEISARLGRVTGRGIATNIRQNYPAWVLYPIVLVLLIANTINIGADIGAMGACLKLIVGGPSVVYCALFAILIVVTQILCSYRKFADILKWMTVVLFAYIATAFFAHVDWKTALRATIIPPIAWHDKAYISMLIAVLGTTISPYLFFWQAAMEREEIKSKPEDQPLKKDPSQARQQLSRIRVDTLVGMSASNIVAFFIMLTAAATIYPHHGADAINSAQEAAEALRPVAGRGAEILFALGIIGTGLLAVPVLAGSAAYGVGEALKWPTGINRKPHQAKGFYGILVVSTLLGLAINIPALHVNPIRALVWAAVINGIAAVPVMVITMLMFSRKSIMGQFTRTGHMLRVIGWIATGIMTIAAGIYVAGL